MDNPATNTTTPSNPPYLWVEEPELRGTFGIISFCLSTLIICIWSTLHFNIPTKRYTETRRFFFHVFWMFLALLAPELLLFLAINERISAGTLLRKVLKFHPRLAEPGMLAGNTHERTKSTNQQRYHLIEQKSKPHFGLVHAFYAMMGGFAFYGPDASTVEETPFDIAGNPRRTVDVPKWDTLLYIMRNFPHIITHISEEDILDRAESNSLCKAILIVQVGWFCANCVSRVVQGLPLSLLEVSTAAHACCTLLTYFVWWSKPMNVPAPTLLREKEAREVYALLKCSDIEYDQALETARKRAEGHSSGATEPHDESSRITLAANALQHLLPTPERPPLSGLSGFEKPGIMLVPGNFRNRSPMENFSVSTTTAISPILYGLVHFLAWNDQFPTPMERVLWCISSFVVTVSGLVCISVLWALKLLEEVLNFGHTVQALVFYVALIVIPSVHLLASGFLIAESFRQLLFLEPTAYQLPSWSNYWPHLS